MLKRIKIQGYKSLADLELNLKPLSGLVGPNASGKSNFLYALQLSVPDSNLPDVEGGFLASSSGISTGVVHF